MSFQLFNGLPWTLVQTCVVARWNTRTQTWQTSVTPRMRRMRSWIFFLQSFSFPQTYYDYSILDISLPTQCFNFIIVLSEQIYNGGKPLLSSCGSCESCSTIKSISANWKSRYKDQKVNEGQCNTLDRRLPSRIRVLFSFCKGSSHCWLEPIRTWTSVSASLFPDVPVSAVRTETPEFLISRCHRAVGARSNRSKVLLVKWKGVACDGGRWPVTGFFKESAIPLAVPQMKRYESLTQRWVKLPFQHCQHSPKL